METITIGGIVMPRTRSLEVGGETVAKEATMASGLLVRDIIGYRKTLRASWEWIPQETLSRLTQLVRSGNAVEVLYPDPVSGDETALFTISIGNAKVFKFIGGEPRWYNVDLDAKALGVS